MGTREAILSAATAMALEDGETRPSVRAVAARAEVGASTLRYYFPRQQDLMEAVLGELHGAGMPDLRIHDASLPAVERLTECVGTLLERVGTQEQARELWRQLFRTLADAEGARGYVPIAVSTRERVESWLLVLEREGTLAPGDNAMRASYLLTVVDGLAVGRLLPGASLGEHEEPTILRAAVDAVLTLPWPAPSSA